MGWHGYKLVGDNIDKNIHPRHQTTSHQTKSIHYFHFYGVKDRVDLTEVDDVAPSVPKSLVYEDFRPSILQTEKITENFCTYAAR